MKKEELIERLRKNELLQQTYDRVQDPRERQRVKEIADAVFVDMVSTLGPLFEAMQSPEVKEELMIQMSTLLSGSST